MLKTTLIPALLIALGLTALCGCQQGAEAPIVTTSATVTSPEPIIQSYTVPDGQQNKITSVLRTLIAVGSDAPGRVTQAPGNRVVVVAPPRLQESVGLFLEDLKENSPPASPPQSLAFDYWLVMGKAAAETDTSSLQSLKAPLEAIARSEGPMAYTLIEKLSVMSVDSESAEVKGQHTKVHHTASANDGVILARTSIQAPSGTEVSTMVQIKPDQFLVLGQLGLDAELAGRFDPDGRDPEASARLFIIVRATLKQ